MSATILKETGAYLQAIRPHVHDEDSPYRHKRWCKRVEKVAEKWRRMDCESVGPPNEICDLLDQIASMTYDAAKGAPTGKLLSDISTPNPEQMPWLPFLTLMAMADQTCRGIGIFLGAVTFAGLKTPKRRKDLKYPADSIVISQAMVSLIAQHKARESMKANTGFMPMTLCRYVDPSRAIVLPKMRTSQRGATIRSFSHHLSLLNGTDVEPVWGRAERVLLADAHDRPRNKQINQDLSELAPEELVRQAGPYNIIVLPWPHDIAPSQFKPFPDELPCLGDRPHGNNQFFWFKHESFNSSWFKEKIDRLIASAKRVVGPIHGLVLPEMAMTRREFDEIFGAGIPSELEFLACGVYEPPDPALLLRGAAQSPYDPRRTLGRNYAIIRRRALPKMLGGPDRIVSVEQEKHHRWALDASQISNYSLGSTLRPRQIWWEGINLPRRSLNFFALDTMTAFTVLICEDLARPDPVADVVRAVGPNLVICLLLDGPQLLTRWSARYATVFADDPGSSVLTLSSLGMVKLSRLRERLHEHSRIIALWREPSGSPTELTLPNGYDALVLSLASEDGPEFTIDGREDSGMATSLRLAGVHPIQW